MKISIEPKVFQKFHPRFKVAFLAVKNIDNKSKLTESKHLLKEVEQLVKLTFNKNTVKNHHLISPWEVARAEFGRGAKHYHTSVEKLLRKVLRRRKVVSNDVITNLVNYLQLKYVVPIAADDLSKINGDVKYSLATGREKKGLLKLHRNELYSKDNSKILSTKLDHWDNKKTKLTAKTRVALIHIDILPPLDSKKMKELNKELKELITTFCGGTVKELVLDKGTISGTI